MTSSHTSSTRFPYLPVLLVSMGHFAHDIFPAFYGVLLPILAPALGLSRGVAGLITLARQVPATLNPFLGYLADRTSVRWFVILAPGLTATGMTLLGWVPNIWTLTLLLFLVGISVALFHAPAPALVAEISHPFTGRGMSFFMAAGELGRSIGPVLAIWGVTALGLRGLPALALLGWMASAILAWRLAAVEARVKNHRSPVTRAELRRWMARMGLPLAVLILGRALIVGSMGTYLTWYLTDSGLPWARAGYWVTVYEAAGVVGALTTGTLSDWLGRRRTIALATGAAAMLLTGMVLTPGPWKPWWLPFLGFTALSVQPVMLALVQDSAVNHRATANGIYIAMSFLLRPIGVTFIGTLADGWGSWDPALLVAAALAVASLAALRWIPTDALRNAPSDEILGA